ncbi:MAG TPA: alpha/beta fold hydrolase [Solirubrobacteraceae bacterium]
MSATQREKAAYRDPGLGPGRDLVLRQGTIRVHEAGEGPAVVLVHGALVNANLWRRVVPELARSAHVVTLDLPLGAHLVPMPEGAALDPPALADLIADALEALGLEDVTIVGNDTGGGLCQIVTTRRPERIGALVLTSCDAFDHFPPPAVKPFLVPLRSPAVAKALFALSTLGLLQQAMLRPLARRPIERAVRDSYIYPALLDAAVRRDVAAVARGLDPRYTREAAERLAAFDKPALIAWSAKDLLFSKEHARRLAELLPQGRLEWIEGARSFSPEDRPEVLAGLIAEVAVRAPVAAG